MTSILQKTIGNNGICKKIKTVFLKSGFEINSGLGVSKEEMLVSLGKSKIMIQCNDKIKNEKEITKIISDYGKKVLRGKANAGIVVLSGFYIPKDYLCFHEKEKVAIWDNSNVDYYKDLVGKINKFAACQILSDLNIHQKFGKDIILPFLNIKQFNKEFYLTKIPIDWIIRSSYVLRRTRPGDIKSYQRLLNSSRIKYEIPDHLNDEGIFPNSIILVSRDNLDFSGSKIKLRSETGSLWIMDGQHRVYSFANVDNKKIINGFELPCVIFNGEKTSKREQAEIFVDINQNAKPVSKALTLELQDSFGLPVAEGVQLVKHLQGLDFIKNRVKMYAEKIDKKRNNTISFVTFATNQATESILEQIKLKDRKKGKDLKLKETQKAFTNFYKIFYKVFKIEWDDPENFVFSTDKGVRALAHLLYIFLKTNNYKMISDDKLEEIFTAMKKGNPIISINDTRKSFAGESGASDLASKWIESIRSGGIADFAVDVLGGVVAELIDDEEIKNRDSLKAKKILKKWFNNFKGNIYGRFNFGDVTTIKLLDNFLNDKVKEVRLIIDVVRGEEDVILKEIAKIKAKRKITIKLISSSQEIDVKGETKEVPITHGRWISDGRYRIMNEMDLNASSMASKGHRKQFLKVKQDDYSENFEKEWCSLLEHKDVKIKLYE